RGQFVRGLYDMGTAAGAANRDTGRALGSAQSGALQGHRPGMYYQATNGNGGTGSSGRYNYGASNPGNGFSDHVRQVITDGSYGTVRVASETRPRNVALNYIIKT